MPAPFVFVQKGYERLALNRLDLSVKCFPQQVQDRHGEVDVLDELILDYVTSPCPVRKMKEQRYVDLLVVDMEVMAKPVMVGQSLTMIGSDHPQGVRSRVLGLHRMEQSFDLGIDESDFRVVLDDLSQQVRLPQIGLMLALEKVYKPPALPPILRGHLVQISFRRPEWLVRIVVVNPEEEPLAGRS